jgi:hypothetical protein
MISQDKNEKGLGFVGYAVSFFLLLEVPVITNLSPNNRSMPCIPERRLD